VTFFFAMAETATGMPITQPTAHAGHGHQGSYGDDGYGQRPYDPGAYEYEAYGQPGDSHAPDGRRTIRAHTRRRTGAMPVIQ
jgi:hypothetical protein